VVGWRGAATSHELFFGTLMEQLLRDRHYTLVLARLTEPLNTCQRILLALPPHAEREEGFATAMGLVKRLSQQLAAPIMVLAEQAESEALQTALQRIKPLAEFRPAPPVKWSGILATLQAQRADGDLVVLYGVRPGGLAAEPVGGGLPHRVAERMRDIPFISIYPAEPQEEDVVETGEAEGMEGSAVRWA
jgi:hypothetical protein